MPSKDTPFCVITEKYISVLQYIKHISHMHHGLDNLISGLRNDYFYSFLSKIGSNHVTLILGLQINPFTEYFFLVTALMKNDNYGDIIILSLQIKCN